MVTLRRSEAKPQPVTQQAMTANLDPLRFNEVAFESGATATTDLVLAMANGRDTGGLPGNPRDLTLQGQERRGAGCAIEDATLERLHRVTKGARCGDQSEI